MEGFIWWCLESCPHPSEAARSFAPIGWRIFLMFFSLLLWSYEILRFYRVKDILDVFYPSLLTLRDPLLLFSEGYGRISLVVLWILSSSFRACEILHSYTYWRMEGYANVVFVFLSCWSHEILRSYRLKDILIVFSPILVRVPSVLYGEGLQDILF